MNETPNLVEGAENVVAYYLYWPSFHDAEVKAVHLDCKTHALTIDLVLNDMINDDGKSHLANVTLCWHDVEEFRLSGEYSTFDTDWLDSLTLTRDGDWTITQLIPNDGINGTIRARHVQVTSFEPIAE